MYKFNENSLYFNENPLFENIQLWVNAKRFPWEQDQKDIIPVPYKYSDESGLHFESEGGAAKFTLSLKTEDNSFALYLEGGYEGLFEHGLHLDSLKGIGIDLSVQHTGNYVSGYMEYLFWQKPFIHKSLKALKPRTQVLLYKKNSKKVYLNTVCDHMFKTELFPKESNRISLIASSNTLCDTVNECMLIGAYGNDEGVLPEQAVGFGLKVMNKTGKLRKEKKYPEELEYLGWCSWDAFQHYVTTEKLLQKCQEFEDKDIPVRWAIIDDTWNDVTHIDLDTKVTRELNDWEAAPDRFPKGLKDCIQRIKENYGLKVGIWHPINGYWYGIRPDGPLAKRIPELLEYTIPGKFPWGPTLMHSFDKKKVEKYYDIQHKFYKDCGADFTKVDNQGSLVRFSYFKGGIGECAKNMHSAIEKAAKKYYGGTLINCMGMPIENFWNRGDSAVNRFSGDFLPEDRKWFIEHLLQCSYNTYSQGTVYVGDWDMWWSDDEQAKKNSVLRALSGGPVYVSDKLDRSIKEVILPTVFSDGRVIRLQTPPSIASDCVFADAQRNKRIFKITNTWEDSGLLAAFNLDKDEKAVNGTVSPKDIRGLKKGRYVVYDWFNNSTAVLDYNQKLPVQLENYDDFRLLLFVPIKNGKAVIGLKEKYNSVATYKTVKGGIKALDEGTMLIFDENENKLNEYKVEKDQIVIV
jgi:hypothetical protein